MQPNEFEADGRRILSARLAFGAARGKALSQGELGTLIGVGQRTVASWEQGRKRPGIDTYIKMARLFGCTVDSLLGSPAEEPTPEKEAVEESPTVHPLQKEIQRFPVATPIIHDRKKKRGTGGNHG